MTAELLNLPWQIQVSVASGYAAYLLAYVGLRGHHKAIDIAFVTLVFGLFATAVLALAGSYGAVIAGIAAFLVACGSGIIWRKWGRSAAKYVLRSANVSWSDDDPSALATLSANTKFPLSGIAVLLDDGTWLRCDDTSKFHDAPFGPCLLGQNGDVALYLTHEDKPDSESKELTTVRNKDYGDRITYVPASRIRLVTLRHISR
ncbi:MAG TPA: hypothetical protein VF449_01360 [Parvibaculum sp.]